MKLSQTLLAALFVSLGHACASSTSHSGAGDLDGGRSADAVGSSSSSSGGSSGSTSGSGSSSGSAPMEDGGTQADSGGEAGANPGCSGLPLCDGFESDTVGMPPSGSLWTLVGTMGCSGTGNPSAPVTFPIVVDNTQHNTGNNSVKVVGGDSCGPLMVNTTAFSSLTNGEVYGRFFVHLSDTTMTFDHAVLAALGLNPGGPINPGDQTSYLQLASEGAGNATNVLMWQTTDGNILPNKNAMGGAESTYPGATGFTCIEFHTSASSKAIEAWVNGTSVVGLTDPPTSANATQWTAPSPFSVTSFGLGWIVFSGESLTAWFDDVALSGSRIGCQ